MKININVTYTVTKSFFDQVLRDYFYWHSDEEHIDEELKWLTKLKAKTIFRRQIKNHGMYGEYNDDNDNVNGNDEERTIIWNKVLEWIEKNYTDDKFWKED